MGRVAALFNSSVDIGLIDATDLGKLHSPQIHMKRYKAVAFSPVFTKRPS